VAGSVIVPIELDVHGTCRRLHLGLARPPARAEALDLPERDLRSGPHSDAVDAEEVSAAGAEKRQQPL
jgi:hypothetical protein